MEEKGLRTKANQDAFLEAGKKIDSSARGKVDSKGKWHVLLFEDKPAEDRATIWIEPKHIRIYGGKNTRIFNKLPDEPDYKYSHKERRITFYSADEAMEFIEKNLIKQGTKLVDSINTPMLPKGMSAEGFVVICPRCDTKFKRADRCPDCGQLIKYQED